MKRQLSFLIPYRLVIWEKFGPDCSSRLMKHFGDFAVDFCGFIRLGAYLLYLKNIFLEAPLLITLKTLAENYSLKLFVLGLKKADTTDHSPFSRVLSIF